MAFKAHCEGREASLEQNPPGSGEWQGELCMAVAPGDYSISFIADDNGLAAGVQLPRPRDVTVTAAPFISNVGLEFQAPLGMVAGAPLEAYVTLTPAPGASRTISVQNARQGLNVAHKEHQLTFSQKIEEVCNSSSQATCHAARGMDAWRPPGQSRVRTW